MLLPKKISPTAVKLADSLEKYHKGQFLELSGAGALLSDFSYHPPRDPL